MMNINECSIKLRELSKAHAHYQITLEDYQRDRKALLDALDLNVNGIETPDLSVVPLPTDIATADIGNVQHEAEQQLDKTQPYFAKKLDSCMNFIKGSNNSS